MKLFNLSCTLTALLVSVAFAVAACGGAVSAHIGGTVKGLSSGNKVSLINNANGDTVTVEYNSAGNEFTFDKTVDPGMLYNVTVLKQPTNQICSVANGIATISESGADVTDIEVTCESGSGVGVAVPVNVVGLGSGSVVLTLNDDQINTLTVTTAGGTTGLVFPKTLLPGTSFFVAVKYDPVGQKCDVPISTGTIPATGGGSPSTVVVTCRTS